MVTNIIKLDKRVEKINETLVAFSQGNFLKKTKPTDKFDTIDAIMFSLNLLGEEMNATTISKNYFTQIYNNISELIFELDANGNILNCNEAVTNILGWNIDELKNKSFKKLIYVTEIELNKTNYTNFNNKSKSEISYLYLKDKNDNLFYYKCERNLFKSKYESKIKYLLTAKDISIEKKLEKDNMGVMLKAQEIERNRLAKDLHDSIGQQLSALKLYLGSFKNLETNISNLQLITNCGNLVNNISQEIRNICFALLPRTLGDAGLIKALLELAQQINSSTKIKINITGNVQFKNQEVEIQLYRTLQEFINNSIKHSKCNKIDINFTLKKTQTYICIKDNGIGFKVEEKENKTNGLGLYSMKNRIDNINGKLKITSILNKGTKLEILF